MKHRKQLAIVSLALSLVIVLGSVLPAVASIAPFTGYRQTYSVTLLSDLGAIRGAQPGYIAACSENGKAYVAQPSAAYPVSPPRVVAGQDGIVWVDFLTVASPITSSFIGSILFSQIVPSSLPTAGSAHGITDLTPNSRRIAGAAPITVNGAASATLTNDITLGLTYGTTASSVSMGGINSPGLSSSAARSDHIHAAPAIGTIAGTLAAGNDTRFSDDRTASGLRSTTTVVNVSGATAPSANQVLTALSPTSATWRLIVNSSIDPSAAIALSKLATCATNQLIVGGSANACSAFTDALHGNRGGGPLHSTVSSGGAGFAPATTVGQMGLLGTPDGSSIGWLNGLSGAYFADNGVGVNKLTLGSAGQVLKGGASTNAWGTLLWSEIGSKPTTFTPSAHASTHVTGGSDVIPDAVAGGNSGLMPGAYRAKVDGIPAALTGAHGYLLTPSDTSNGVYELASTTHLQLVSGSNSGGVNGQIPKWTAPDRLGPSLLHDNGTGIAIGHTNAANPLDIRGSSGNTALKLYDTGTTYANWNLVSGTQPGNNGVFYLNNVTAGTIPLFVRHSGLVGVGTVTPLGQLDVANGGVGFTASAANLAGASLTPYVGTARLVLGWNRSNGWGEHDFISNRGGGSQGGFEFYDLTAAGTLNALLRIDGDGNTYVANNLSIGGGSPGAGKLLRSDANGTGSWESPASLGLFRNGDNLAFVSDGMMLATSGYAEVNSGFFGYNTQEYGNGRSLTFRAQTSSLASGGNGGSAYIYGGSIPGGGTGTPGGVYLVPGTNGTKSGDVNASGAALVYGANGAGTATLIGPPVGVRTEEYWAATQTTTGNSGASVWFRGMRGFSTIESGAYHVLVTVMPKGNRITATATFIATLRKNGSTLTVPEAFAVSNPQGIVFSADRFDDNNLAFNFLPPGASGSDTTVWDIKLSITKN